MHTTTEGEGRGREEGRKGGSTRVLSLHEHLDAASFVPSRAAARGNLDRRIVTSSSGIFITAVPLVMEEAVL